MGGRGFDPGARKRMDAVLAGHVERDEVPGLAWAIARHGEVHTGTAGTLDDPAVPGGRPVRPDSIFRIASMTKPVVAAAALILVEECVLRLDEPVDRLLPELADRRVLRRPDGPLDDTVPAERPITLRDVLTFRLGWGMDFAASSPQTTLGAMADLQLGIGPPAPAVPPEPDEWMRRIGTLPLDHQPGERWLYHLGSEVLGVLVARAAGQPLDVFLRERIFEPLGMRDTGFWVPPDELDRFGTCWTRMNGPRELFDAPDGQWSAPPAFPSGGGGLVSTVDDYLSFALMLLQGGTHRGQRILARSSVEAMTTDHLTVEQRTTGGPTPTGEAGWGFGVGVVVERTGTARSVGSYGWDGGLGSTWSNDPAEDVVGIMLTTQTFSSPAPPPVVADFWTATYAAVV
jgi:CubicO group peptidase (beta-lactamase class C family)